MKKLLIVFGVLLTLAGCCERPQEPEVKNIILMIGDGMGLAQITALSLAHDYAPIAMDRAQYVGLQKTYSSNNRVTDSGASGTAIATGHKTNNGSIAVDTLGNPVESILILASQAGMATGIIVSNSVTTPTPAVFATHSRSRSKHSDLALQYVNSGIDLLVGGGRRYFYDRPDERNLIDEMVAGGYNYFSTKSDFLSDGKLPTLALLAENKLPYLIYDTLNERGNYLAEATHKSLELLHDSDKRGFFIMIEGSSIDEGGHRRDYDMLMAEMQEFDNAVEVAFDFADRNPGTLVIVTGDHETGGLAIMPYDPDFEHADSGLKYVFGGDSHSGTMIPIFAYGTGAENFTTIMENTGIFKRMRKALNL